MIIFNVALEYTPIWVESLYSHVYVCVCVYVGRAPSVLVVLSVAMSLNNTMIYIHIQQGIGFIMLYGKAC